jgi:hypothetical protein
VISTFYIYADGADLEDIAFEMRARIEKFIEPYQGRVRVVDQREEKEKEESPELPDWDLGVNFEIESLSDVEKKDLLLFFHSLSAEFGRDFILGGALPHGLSGDFVSVSAAEPLEPAIDLLLAYEKKG